MRKLLPSNFRRYFFNQSWIKTRPFYPERDFCIMRRRLCEISLGLTIATSRVLVQQCFWSIPKKRNNSLFLFDCTLCFIMKEFWFSLEAISGECEMSKDNIIKIITTEIKVLLTKHNKRTPIFYTGSTYKQARSIAALDW